MNHDHSVHESQPKPFWSSRYAVGLIVLGAVATYFLLSEHRAHFFTALPFLLLLSCPLMHVFMHGSHGGHGGDHGNHQDSPQSAQTPPAPKASKIGEQP